MSVEKLIYNEESTKNLKAKFMFHYTEYFYNKWMNKYKFPELSYQQNEYIMKRYWAEGTVACINAQHSTKEIEVLEKEGLIDMKNDKLVFCPWTTGSLFNVYDYPISARAVNKRGVAFIPNKELKLDEEIIIGYIQKNHKSIWSSIEVKVAELVDIEMKMRVARKAQSQPWTFVGSPEDQQKLKKFKESLDNDNPYIFLDLEDPDKAKILQSGAPYITDKQEQDRQKVFNDILTILGCNNVGVAEKKEHLTVNEVDANNQEIESSSGGYKGALEDFFERINKAFKYKVTVIDLEEEMQDNIDEDEEEEEMDKEDIGHDE